jgi:hypothetical protein
MLRDQVAAGADLAQALQTSAARPPAALAVEVRTLAGRLRREPPQAALADFAAAVADPTADVVAAALSAALSGSARQLSDLLSTAADSARAQASMRAKVESERARTRTTAQLAAVVVVGWVGLLYAISSSFFTAYDSAVGQLVLTIDGALFATGLVALSRLDRIPSPPRLALPAAGEQAAR